MSIDVDLVIPVPVDTDNYNLVLDLNSMRAGILNSLNDVIAELAQRPETGSNAEFNSIVTTLGGTFGGSVTVVSSDSGSSLVLANSSTEFGMTKGANHFKFIGSKFVSTAPVQIVDGVSANDAVTQTYVAGQMAIAKAWDDAVQATVTALDARSVIRYNGLQEWAPHAAHASSADSAGSANTANTANTANYATSAGSANTANLINGRSIVTGKSPQFSTAGGADQNKSVSFGTTFGAVPIVVYSITEDNGRQSMLSSIDSISTTGFTVNVTNTNSSVTENYKIIWIAIG